jgi:MFS family permease
MLTFINFFSSVNFFALMSVVPIYALNVFHMNEGQAGFATGIFAVGILASRFIAGRFVTPSIFKSMLSFGLILLTVISIGYFFAAAPLALYAVRFISGFAFGITSTTNITIISSIVPKERSGEGVGYYSLGQVLSMALGPFLGVRLAMDGNYTAVFAICIILPAIGIGFLPFLRLRNIHGESHHSEDVESVLSRFVEFRIIPIASLAFLLYFVINGVTSFMAVYAETIDLVQPAAYFLLIHAVVMLVSRPFISKLFDRRGANIVLYPMIAVLAFGILLVSQSHSAETLLIASVFTGLGTGAFTSCLLASLVHLVPLHRLGVANATYFMFTDTSVAVGPMLIGLIVPFSGFRMLFFFGFLIVLLGLPVYHFAHGRKQASRKTDAL